VGAEREPREHEQIGPADTVAFLLSRLGFQASRTFAEALAPLGLEPRDAGVLRAIAMHEGESQQLLAGTLCVPASRMVALVDHYEERGLVERRRNPADRRAYQLQLTPAGRDTLDAIARAGQKAEAAMCAGLNEKERRQLHRLLARLAHEHPTPHGLHPGLGTDALAG
jgi:DNA-binding MarR family transcriptional regulator